MIDKKNNIERNMAVWFFSLLALLFGFLTLKSGAAVLFFDGEARLAAGNYVPFVLWFNFMAGFLYIITAISLWLMHPYVVYLSWFIAVATLLVFALLGLYIINGGEYEMRTIIAMSLRSTIWFMVAVFSGYYFRQKKSETTA